MRKPQLVFWNQTIFWSPGADDQRGHISVSCEQAARAIGRAAIEVWFLLFKTKHFSPLLLLSFFNNNLIFLLPFFSRKISSSKSRHSAKKNLLENIRIVSSSLRRKKNEILSSTKPWKFFIWPVVDNHCWPRFYSQDWFSGSPTDFSSGCFCWTRDKKILSRLGSAEN